MSKEPGKKRRSHGKRRRSEGKPRKEGATSLAPPRPSPPLSEDVQQAIAALDQDLNRRRERYREYVESIRTLAPLERAEAWLAYVADRVEQYGDQEAIVYLRSRGHSCSSQVAALVKMWKRDELEVMKRRASGTPQFDVASRKTRRIGAMSSEEASDIRSLSPFVLRDFWSGFDHQEFTIDATMLRTVEWCEIGGFNDWWDRLARTYTANILRGGVEPVPAGYLVFNLCRSDFARRIVRSALEPALQAMEVPDHDTAAPWRVFRHTRPGLVAHLGYASALIFANMLLRPRSAQNRALMANAGEALIRAQGDDGAWTIWGDDPSPSIGATAMALHALALLRPHGWERSVHVGEHWLWGAQHGDGCWHDPWDPDPAHLTVLVLDAVELARGGTRVTFTTPGLRTMPAPGQPPHRSGEMRFLVALSFPGEARPEVREVARLLSEALGRDRVFYDEYYEAELARPNLDVHLQRTYRDDSLLVVLFISADYAHRPWCGLEWRAIRDLIKAKRDSQIMPVRLDDTEIPGLFSIDGYLDFRDHTLQAVAQLILDRVGQLQRGGEQV